MKEVMKEVLKDATRIDVEISEKLGLTAGKTVLERPEEQLRSGHIFVTSTFYPEALGAYTSCIFYRCTFMSARDRYAFVNMTECAFIECTFEHQDWDGLLSGCSFIDCVFKSCEWDQLVSVDCRMFGVRMRDFLIPKSQEWLRAAIKAAAQLEFLEPEEHVLESGPGKECKELLKALDEVWDCDKLPEFIRRHRDNTTMLAASNRIRADRLKWM